MAILMKNESSLVTLNPVEVPLGQGSPAAMQCSRTL